jgi:hypothetical protein
MILDIMHNKTFLLTQYKKRGDLEMRSPRNMAITLFMMVHHDGSYSKSNGKGSASAGVTGVAIIQTCKSKCRPSLECSKVVRDAY